MKAVFPGKPQAKLQALSTALWEGQRVITYISQNALIILRGPNDLIQTTQHDESEALEAVAISADSGKIATCTKHKVYVYSPFGHDVGAVNWSLQHTLTSSRHDSSLSSLSWGVGEELLVAGSCLTIFDTVRTAREAWSKELANPAKFAAFTPDAGFIASTGHYDRLVKIWRRQFLGGEEEEERFDVSYLAHPSSVTSIRWHRRPDQDHHADTVLYTTCGDYKLRIWAATSHHPLQALELWSEIDLKDCILPRSPTPPSETPQRYAFIVDGWEFETMVEDAIHFGLGTERDKHTREHLLDVAYRNPDVCVVMDDRGNMSAWGLERVGCKAREPNDIFNIVLAEGLDFDARGPDAHDENFVCFCNFAGIKDGRLNILANMFDGTVEWLSSPVDCFFDTSPSTQRLRTDAIWTGHAEPIEKLVCSARNNSVLSLGFDDEVVVWAQNPQADLKTVLTRHSAFTVQHGKSHACLLFDDQYAAFLFQSTIEIWNMGKPASLAAQSHNKDSSQSPACFMTLPRIVDDSSHEYLVLIIDALRAVVWRVSLEDDYGQVSIAQFAECDLTQQNEPQTLRAVKPESPQNSSHPLAYSFSNSGTFTLWYASLDVEARGFVLKPRPSIPTGIKEPAMTRVAANGQAVIVSSAGTSLSIWDLQCGHLEFSEKFAEHETIQGIDIASVSGRGAMIAVAFSHKSLVYVQDRYCSTPQSAAWTLVKAIDIGDSTNVPIADCVWLANHDLLLAAGNQMFLFDNEAEVPKGVHSFIEVTKKLNANAPLPSITASLNSVPAIFNPNVLAQVLLSGDIEMVDRVLITLREKLKFWAPGDHLDSQLAMPLKTPPVNGLKDLDSDEDAPSPEEDYPIILSQDAATALKDILQGIDLPFIPDDQQQELASLGETIGAFENNRRAMDSLAARYIVQLHLLIKQPPKARSTMSWRDITFASHSVSQDVMVDLTSRMYNGRLLWKDARECGMFMWLSDIDALRAQFEIIARNEYTKTDERNPIDCTLHYLALKKKQVLVGLWRMATWNREQTATLKLLGNNFNDRRWKTAAQKNAYALLSLRRFEYAAAFFLLADCPKDAVNVLVSQSKDIQLAITVARVYEGDDGPVLKQLLRERILPQAAREGNRWLASLSFWLLKHKGLALRALTDPLPHLIGLKEQPSMDSYHYSNNEPALAHFYAFLRDHLLSDPRERNNVAVEVEAEWDLVMRSAASYVRAGCHFLALDLVRNWKFSHEPLSLKTSNGNVAANALPATTTIEAATPLTNGDETKGAEQAGWNVSLPERDAETAAAGKKPRRKQVTEEPSAASILDNFDF